MGAVEPAPAHTILAGRVEIPTPVAHSIDVGAVFAIGATFIGALPTIAAILGVVWYILLIYDYVQKHSRGRRERSKFRQRKTDV